MFEAVVMGLSAGGVTVLTRLIPALPENFSLAMIIVQHIRSSSDDFLTHYLNNISPIRVKEAAEKEIVDAGTVYFAPPGYHLLIEGDKTFSLSIDPAVNFSRPSIDVLFESAADVYAEKLVGIIMTGANADGAHGLKMIKEAGGLTIVQNPETAEVTRMPSAALKALAVDKLLEVDEIAQFLTNINGNRA